jgi:hypothetical protein
MNKLLSSVLFASLAFAAPLLASSTARADSIADCGNIDVSANATCKVEVSGGCKLNCTPVSFEASCTAKGNVSCKGECDAKVSVQAELDSCKADCEGGCAANPNFSCEASCSGSVDADCDASCSGQAGGNNAKGQCKADCKAKVQAKCSASCNGSPVTCTPVSCEASCKGKLEAKAQVDCSVTCSSNLEASCEAELKGGCDAQCDAPEGALYCDGNYVDAGGNLSKCINSLEAALNLKVDASASAKCANGTCEAEAEAGASCGGRVVGDHSPMGPAGLVLGGAALGLVLARRRRA